ncbi:MAG: hypothetical protein JWQ38_159 [Flavipsychrobacter sp.]|nr:hypothetical protein [Flavipsychrobacter sp.]
MRSIKPIALILFITFSVFGAVFYSSCSKSVCSGVTCLHGSKCNGGICDSCPSGTGGANCEIEYRKRYTFTYKGTSLYNTPTYGLSGRDSNNSLTFVLPATVTPYNTMTVTWDNPGNPKVSLPIVITNSSENGSNFTITETPFDTLIYTGTGSVNGTTASISLTKSRINNPSVKTYVQFNDFNKETK